MVTQHFYRISFLMFSFILSFSSYSQSVICDYQRGWTKHVTGGLGGKVIKVTNLNTEGKGSLKSAIKAEGARVIVFEVSGSIDLQGKMLKVSNPFLTIAGQTSPSPGITLINGGVKIKTHDVVIQHLHVRPGALGHKKGWEPDGISVQAGHNIIIDHNSLSWAVDENLTASGPRFGGESIVEWQNSTSHHVTFSNNIIAEGLDNATHSEGPHSKGSLIHDNVQNILIYQNLFSSNRKRNPHFKGGTHGAVINNVISNPGNSIIRYAQHPKEWKGKEYSSGQMYIVGNTVFRGKDTRKHATFLRVTGLLSAHIYDNHELNQELAPLPLVVGEHDKLELTPKLEILMDIQPAEEAEKKLWRTVGARPWDRDKTDLRIIEQAKSRTTRVIDFEPEKQKSTGKPVARSKFREQDWDACFIRKH